MDDGTNVVPHRLHQRGKLALGIADQNIVIRVEHEEGDQFLYRERFARAGHTEDKRRLVQQRFLIAHNEVVGDGVLAEVDAALVHDLLHLEGNEHGKALRRQRPEGVNAPRPDGQHGIEPVILLVLQHGKLTHVLAGNGQHGLGVALELLLCFRSKNHSENAQHHALVAGGEIVQKLLGLPALEFHVIGDHGGKVIVGVLTALPVGDVRLHAKQAVFHLAYRLVGGDGDNINREHHVPAQIRQLRHQTVLDIGSVVLEIQHPAEAPAEL